MDATTMPLPPAWSLRRPKPLWQAAYDFLGAPARMAALPDRACEGLHLTSLRAERFAAVLPELRGRVLDVGAGDNALVRLYRARAEALGQPPAAAGDSVGVDVVDWGADSRRIESSARLPFADAGFDTVCFIACLNHIPERAQALAEARRVMRPGGRVVLTMIDRLLGTIGHAIWWYSEDKHRAVAADEEPGLDAGEMRNLIAAAGFVDRRERRFCYGLNRLYVASRGD